jgi:predicted transcriptional regulator
MDILSIAIGSQAEPITFSGISFVADGINHAIPSHKELQTAISWLTKNSLIIKNGRRYNLTKLGNSEYKTASNGVGTLLITWENLERKFFDYDQ